MESDDGMGQKRTKHISASRNLTQNPPRAAIQAEDSKTELGNLFSTCSLLVCEEEIGRL